MARAVAQDESIASLWLRVEIPHDPILVGGEERSEQWLIERTRDHGEVLVEGPAYGASVSLPKTDAAVAAELVEIGLALWNILPFSTQAKIEWATARRAPGRANRQEEQ